MKRVAGNCIIWHNTQQLDNCSIPSYSCIEDWDDTGIGNISADPNFIDPDGPDNDPNTWQDNDYHLQWNSPCINTGDPNYIPGEEDFDIDGEPRVMAGRIDIGADEVGPKQADFTRDGIINTKDFAVFAQSWLASTGQENWYILKLEGHKDANEPSYDEIKAQVKDAYMQQNATPEQELVQERFLICK